MINQKSQEEIQQLRSHFEQYGYVNVPNFLEEAYAEELLLTFLKENEWDLATLVKGRPFLVSSNELFKQAPGQIHEFINEAVLYAAQNPFQYFYEQIRLNSDDDRVNNKYRALFDLLNGEEMLGLLKEITGESNAESVIESQLTKYTANYFLKRHTDNDENNPFKRHAAYVLGFTKDWSADWGGVLNLLEKNSGTYKALLPEFNNIHLFKVPTEHFVSQVANFCPKPRIAVSGWLGSKR